MKISQRIKFFLFEKIYGKKIYREVLEWSNKVKAWKQSDWMNYWIDSVNRKLNLPWNKKFYGVNRIRSLDDLLSFPILNEIPKMDFKGKIIGYSTTSGTTGKPKMIPITPEDVSLGVKGLRAYFNINVLERNNLFVSSGIEYTSGTYFELTTRVIRSAGGKSYHITLGDILRKRKVKEKFDNLFVILSHIYPLVRTYGNRIFKEHINVITTGDVISEALARNIENLFEEVDVSVSGIFNMYAASEVVGLIAASLQGKYDELTVFPDFLIPYIRRVKIKGDNIEFEDKIFPLWKANKGDMGMIVITSLRDLLLVNYSGLKDIIVVKDSNVFPPVIYPTGRHESVIEIGYSKVLDKELVGKYGTIVRVAGIPLNLALFSDFLSKKYPKNRFFILVEDEGVKATLKIYSQEKIDIKEVLEDISKKGFTSLDPFVKAQNLEYVNIVNRELIKEIYEDLPNKRVIEGRRTPKVIEYLVIRKW